MKQTVVKNVVNEFVKKYDVNSVQLKENLEDFLWKSIRTLRNEDEWLYEHIYNDYSTMMQFDILTERLELEYCDIGKISTIIIEGFADSFEKALELNKPDGYEHVNDYVNVVLEDTFIYLQESDIIDKVKYESGETAKKLIGIINKAWPTIIASIGIISIPFIGLGIKASLGVLMLILMFCSMYTIVSQKYFGLSTVRDQINLFKSIAHVFSVIGDILKKPEEEIKYRYILTFKNEESCYKRAGIKYTDLGFRHMMSMKDDSFFRSFMDSATEHKIDILRNCFVEAYLERIAIFFDLYFDCLKKTGRWNEVRDMSDDKVIAMFHMHGGMFPLCDEYKEKAVDAIGTYESLLDFIYQDKPEKKSKWLLLLNRYIVDSKNNKEKIMNDHRDSISRKRPGFTSEKNKRMGKDLETHDSGY